MASIDWNVNNAGPGGCDANTLYSSPNDGIRGMWSGKKDSTGNQALGKVTATPGTYNFDCIVPAGVGGCAGDTSEKIKAKVTMAKKMLEDTGKWWRL